MSKNRHNKTGKPNTTVQQSQIHQSVQFKGPLPLPSIIKGYEEACPGSADRIIKMAEKQAEHRMKLEEKVVTSNTKKESIGQLFAFIIALSAIIGGVIIIISGKSAEGLAVVIGALVALVGVFIYVRHVQ